MAKLILEKDDTCRNILELSPINEIKVEKPDIFNYGVFHYEIPPEKIGENDFEYLQSKIPAYYMLYDDQIDIPDKRNAIICKVSGEAAKNVSEIVGIGIGLKAASFIFKIQKKNIQKIGLSGKKEKRLDFRAKKNKEIVEIETKGTTNIYTVRSMIKDIHDKKIGKINGVNRYGFVTLLRKDTDKDDSRIYITDPDGEGNTTNYKGVYAFINYYLIYLSFILDNPQYNKLVRVLVNLVKFRKKIIKTEKFKYIFEYDKKKYYGQCFDKRLIKIFIDKYIESSATIDKLFKLLTDSIGVEKYFLGIDSEIIQAINSKNISLLENYISSDKYEKINEHEYIQMSDGILFIKSKDGSLPEMEEKFTEEEVKSRLGEIMNYEKNKWHECGAACRSRDIEGKPCEIKTFREHCHFHR